MIIKSVLPTRGLIYAQAISGILKNIDQDDLIIVSGRPMPDCFNEGIQEALDQGADYIWMVEEDNEQPEDVLDGLVALDADIATMDYPVAMGRSHIYERNGEILWCGVGSTLIKRTVFESIPKPWFEVDKHLNFYGDSFELLDLPESRVSSSWGGHDARFFYSKCKPLGFAINKVPDIVGEHYRVKEVPKIETNSGYYTIYSL